MSDVLGFYKAVAKRGPCKEAAQWVAKNGYDPMVTVSGNQKYCSELNWLDFKSFRDVVEKLPTIQGIKAGDAVAQVILDATDTTDTAVLFHDMLDIPPINTPIYVPGTAEGRLIGLLSIGDEGQGGAA